MHTVQLHNLPEKTYLALKTSAHKARRSITQQAIHLIQTALNQMDDIEDHLKQKIRIFEDLKKLDNIDIYDSVNTIESSLYPLPNYGKYIRNPKDKFSVYFLNFI